ncbi:MAG: chromosome segregation SMC family protein, partial [Bryobacteraceae bacterium]
MQGFKSFCDRTELRFNGGGIAAIVGPNGCGKSNLSDAISWVLGEQSAKSLRGSRMEDVIFAGTGARKPLGMASVTMTLVDPGVHYDTADGAPPDKEKPGEITITRRLFRSGESEYLIDGRTARLRDIQDLFMGTGLGPESYAIIEQGRIGLLLSSKPQDRRAVIEEAAGITKYKTRRRLAEARLESAKQNLTRVFDILEEVTRQLNSLKRQAAKARRHGELKSELDAKLTIVLAGRHRRLESAAAAAAAEMERAAAELKSLADEVAAREREETRLETARYATEAKLTESRRQLAELNVEVERTRGRLEYQAKQSGAIEERIAQGEAEAGELEQRVRELEAEVAAHRARSGELEGAASEARARSIGKNEAREALQTRLREGEQALETGRLAVLRLLGEVSTLKNQLAQIDEYLAGLERESSRSTREEEVAAADLARLTTARSGLAKTRAEQQMELESIQDQRRRVDEDLAGRRRSAQEARLAIDERREELSRNKARKDSLDEILSHRAYTTEAVKRLFSAVGEGQAGDFRPLGVLADFVEVDAACEKAAEEFLHEELEYVVVGDWAEAERGLGLMRGEVGGRGTFLVHPEAGGGVAVPEAPEGLARLGDRLRLGNGL